MYKHRHTCMHARLHSIHSRPPCHWDFVCKMTAALICGIAFLRCFSSLKHALAYLSSFPIIVNSTIGFQCRTKDCTYMLHKSMQVHTRACMLLRSTKQSLEHQSQTPHTDIFRLATQLTVARCGCKLVTDSTKTHKAGNPECRCPANS